MEISVFNKGTKLSPYEVMVDQTMKAWLKYGSMVWYQWKSKIVEKKKTVKINLAS